MRAGLVSSLDRHLALVWGMHICVSSCVYPRATGRRILEKTREAEACSGARRGGAGGATVSLRVWNLW